VSVRPPGTLTSTRSNGAIATVAMTAVNTARASMREAMATAPRAQPIQNGAVERHSSGVARSRLWCNSSATDSVSAAAASPERAR
jgi:hypothetical protein